MSAPYLIQRLKRKQVEGSLDQYRFGELFDLEYMGSAEFEFGAFPRLLRDMYADKLVPFTTIVNGRKVFGVYAENLLNRSGYDDNMPAEKIVHLVANPKTRLKESSYFPPTQPHHRADAWIDIDNGVFWSYENISSVLPKIIENSVAYMNEVKKT